VCTWLSQFVIIVTIIVILLVRKELRLEKQLSIVLFDFCGYHVMSVTMTRHRTSVQYAAK
jgi:hypothetical protein